MIDNFHSGICDLRYGGSKCSCGYSDKKDMLIITIKNDATGTNENANYIYEVRVNYDTIAKGKLKGHNRNDGWIKLVKSILEQEEKTCA